MITETKTIYAAQAGRDLALTVEKRTDTTESDTTDDPATVFTVYAFDGDGNPLFEIAATTNFHLVIAMLPAWTQQARERMEVWADEHTDWAGWPSMTDREQGPGPIEDGQVLKWIDRQ